MKLAPTHTTWSGSQVAVHGAETTVSCISATLLNQHEWIMWQRSPAHSSPCHMCSGPSNAHPVTWRCSTSHCNRPSGAPPPPDSLAHRTAAAPPVPTQPPAPWHIALQPPPCYHPPSDPLAPHPAATTPIRWPSTTPAAPSSLRKPTSCRRSAPTSSTTNGPWFGTHPSPIRARSHYWQVEDPSVLPRHSTIYWRELVIVQLCCRMLAYVVSNTLLKSHNTFKHIHQSYWSWKFVPDEFNY